MFDTEKDHPFSRYEDLVVYGYVPDDNVCKCPREEAND